MPQNNQNFVLITRPQPDADDYAAELNAEGYQTITEPMLEIQTHDFAVPDMSNYAGLLFTSANGVRIFSKRSGQRDISVFCVGKNTADEASRAGYSDIHNAKGTGENLVQYVIERGNQSRPYLHIRGTHAAREIDQDLIAANVSCEILVIYETVKVDALSQPCIEALKKQSISVVTFFSARTAETFMELAFAHNLQKHLKSIQALCISDGVIKYVQPEFWRGAYAAESPDRSGMLKLLERYAKTD